MRSMSHLYGNTSMHGSTVCLTYIKGSLQVPQECPQEVADLVDACLDLCADRRPTADDIIGVIDRSARAHSSVVEG